MDYILKLPFLEGHKWVGVAILYSGIIDFEG